MKFFITGSWQSKEGPRTILALTLFMLLLFTIVHAIREGLNLGWTTTSIRQELYMATELNILGPLSIIEDLHVSLLLFTMVLLLLGGLVYHFPLALFYRHLIFFSLNLTVITYLVAKIATHFHPGFAVITLVSGLILHLGFVLILLVLFAFLFAKIPKK